MSAQSFTAAHAAFSALHEDHPHRLSLGPAYTQGASAAVMALVAASEGRGLSVATVEAVAQEITAGMRRDADRLSAAMAAGDIPHNPVGLGQLFAQIEDMELVLRPAKGGPA